MRIARILLLSCALALTALTFGAPTASAQETEIELTKESIGNGHCNPCRFHTVGSFQVRFLGMLVAECQDEFRGTLLEDGSGVVTQWEGADGPSQSCPFAMCNGTGEAAQEAQWPIAGGEIAADTFHMTIRWCLDDESAPNGAGNHCDVEMLGTAESGGSHHYLWAADQLCGGVSYEGSWETESHEEAPENEDPFEIAHL